MQMLPAKARSCAHAWLADNAKGQISYKKIKLRQNKRKKFSKKKDKRLPSFTCLIMIFLTDRQTDRHKNKDKNEGHTIKYK